MKRKIIPEEGVNGLGLGIINTNSKEFKFLQQKIVKASKEQSANDILKNDLLAIRFQMETYLLEDEGPFISAGEFLKRYIQSLKIKYKTFAGYIDIKESNLSALLKGKRKISMDLALKLGQIFSIDPLLWIYIQSKNEFRQLKEESSEKYKKYSIEDLTKRAS